jgi:drug/metabolite transporter (DMT)-like permease
MPLLPVLLIVASAVTHALWNFCIKGGENKLLTLWLMSAFMLLVYALPVGLTASAEIFTMPAIGYLLVSGLIHTVYFVLLTAAYTYGDISLAYPISRGVGILLTSVSAILLLGEHPSIWGYIGISLVVLGVLTLVHRESKKGQPAEWRSIFLALAVSITIWGFYTVDKFGVAYIPAFHYMYLQQLIVFLLLAPYILLFRRRLLFREFKTSWKQWLPGGITLPISYTLALWVMNFTKLAYVVGVREVSVAFGAILGVIFYKERPVFWRVLGACVVALGVIVIGTLG